jgi:hypothetical protein
MAKTQSGWQNTANRIGPPQIWPHLPAFVLASLQRLAAIAIRASRSLSSDRESEFSAVRMKEHDA